MNRWNVSLPVLHHLVPVIPCRIISTTPGVSHLPRSRLLLGNAIILVGAVLSGMFPGLEFSKPFYSKPFYSMSLSVRSDIMPLSPNKLREIVTELHFDQYFQVATVALLVYDTIITLDKEVKYFWKLPRRPVDFIYFMNRYIGIVGAVAYLFHNSFTATLPLCSFSVWILHIANCINIILIDCILMVRVLALHSQDRTLSIFLKTLLTLEVVFMVGTVLYLDILWHPVLDIFAGISLCGRIGSPPWQVAIVHWLIPLLYGTLLMILALYKAAEYWRMSKGFKGFTLVKVLIEDQIIYFSLFLLVISCSVLQALVMRLHFFSALLDNVLKALGNAAYLSVLGSRILFNLKEAGERGQNEGTSYKVPSWTISDMDFAESAYQLSEGRLDGVQRK